ncbi:hypothetical protein [Fibrobacter sp.]|uniref:hypothetical protein n=1 Tax=Fibrobacter sp. TaxID=35828 RepID=UPI0038909A96
MNYEKHMAKLLTSGLPAKAMLRAMVKLMELRKIEREFSNTVDVIKELLDAQEKALTAGLDRIAEELK